MVMPPPPPFPPLPGASDAEWAAYTRAMRAYRRALRRGERVMWWIAGAMIVFGLSVPVVIVADALGLF